MLCIPSILIRLQFNAFVAQRTFVLCVTVIVCTERPQPIDSDYIDRNGLGRTTTKKKKNHQPASQSAMDTFRKWWNKPKVIVNGFLLLLLSGLPIYTIIYPYIEVNGAVQCEMLDWLANRYAESTCFVFAFVMLSCAGGVRVG